MKWKRPLALLGVILILAMYGAAIVSAFSHNPDSKSWLMAAIFSTVLVPVLIYAVQLVGHVLKPDDKDSERDSKN